MDNDLKAFLVESNELLSSIEEHLLAAESKKDKGVKEIISAFGGIHSIKGNAMYLGLDVLVKGCQKAENSLSGPDRSMKIPSAQEFNLLFKFIDAVRDFFRNLEKEIPVESCGTKLSQWFTEN